MYRRISCLKTVVMLIISSFSLLADQTDADRILGTWYTEKCQARFEFFRSGDEFRARLYPIKNPAMKDLKNPIDSLRSRPLRGVTIITGMQYDDKKQRWYNGSLYNPENGKMYSCQCRIKANGTMAFRGFLGVSLLGGSQIWTRDGCGGK